MIQHAVQIPKLLIAIILYTMCMILFKCHYLTNNKDFKRKYLFKRYPSYLTKASSPLDGRLERKLDIEKNGDLNDVTAPTMSIIAKSLTNLLSTSYSYSIVNDKTEESTRVKDLLPIDLKYDKDGILSPTSLESPPRLINFWNSSHFSQFNKSMQTCLHPDTGLPLCVATKDHSKAAISDAFVFDPLTMNLYDMPPTYNLSKTGLSSHALMILMTRESPANIKSRGIKPGYFPPADIGQWVSFFDLLVTYTPQSDINYPYGVRVPLPPLSAHVKLDVDKLADRKLIMAMVTNCKSKERLKYVKELKSIIPEMDLFGKCFENSICMKSLEGYENMTIKDRRIWARSCTRNLTSQYKFIIGVENSDGCPDYITEKYWETPLYTHTIPIVGGTRKESYDLLAIPNSYIHTNDFPNPKSLASYLLTLGKDVNKQLTYLKWTRNWIKYPASPNLMCDLCKKIISLRESSRYGTSDLKNGLKNNLEYEERRKDIFLKWWNGCTNYF